MDASTRPDEPNIPVDPARVDKTHNRPIRIIGLLLILQVVGLVGIGAYEVADLEWGGFVSVNSEEGLSINLDRSQPQCEACLQEDEEYLLVLFLPSALLMLLSGLGFLLLKRRGWLLAAIAQGLTLGACLFFYTEGQPDYIYPIMLYCILMILYLNSHDVRVVFHARRDPAKRNTKATRGS